MDLTSQLSLKADHKSYQPSGQFPSLGFCLLYISANDLQYAIVKSNMKNSPKTLADNLVRLEKYIALKGLASRREAKDLILRGRVSVNGSPALNPGTGIHPKHDKVKVDQDIKKESVLVYKPRGIETSNTGTKLRDIKDVLPKLKHLSPIGRLDAESEGLIILSNDGVLAKAFTGTETHIEKTYKVEVRGLVTDLVLKQMSIGMMIEGVKTKPAKTEKINNTSFYITLREGRKHQIRKMCSASHLHVMKLIRVAIGAITIGKMKSGEVRPLTTHEIEKLKRK